MSLYILALVALLPFALVGFMYREAHVDTRQALIWLAAISAAVILLFGLLFEIA